nr:unnamed protein product [Callosobruchus chinensis]
MIWHEYVSSTTTAAGKKLGYLFRYKAQIRPSLEYCSHIWGVAAPTTLSILDAPLSHQRAIGDLSLFYQYSNGFCSSELTSMVPPHFKPARCTRGTSSSHPRALSSRSTLVFRPCLRDLLSYKKNCGVDLCVDKAYPQICIYACRGD